GSDNTRPLCTGAGTPTDTTSQRHPSAAARALATISLAVSAGPDGARRLSVSPLTSTLTCDPPTSTARTAASPIGLPEPAGSTSDPTILWRRSETSTRAALRCARSGQKRLASLVAYPHGALRSASMTLAPEVVSARVASGRSGPYVGPVAF